MPKVVAMERLHDGVKFIEIGETATLTDEQISSLGNSVQVIGDVPPTPPAKQTTGEPTTPTVPPTPPAKEPTKETK